MSRLRSDWTSVAGYRMHALVAAGPPRSISGAQVPTLQGSVPIVLQHGLSVSSRYYLPTAVVLSDRYAVSIPDLPGFGQSDKPPMVLGIPALTDVLAAWLDAQGIRRAVLVGHSMGAQIVTELAVRRPGLVVGLVLAGPTVDRWHRTLIQQALRLGLDLFRESPGTCLTAFEDYLRAGPRRTVGTYSRAIDDHIEDRLPRLACPTLIVRGERDPISTQRWCEYLASLLPNGRLRVIPGAPHAINSTTPEAFAACIEEFLAEMGARSGGNGC